MYRKLLLTTVVALAVTASIPSLQAAEDDSVSTTKTDILLKDGTWKDVEAVIAKHPGKIVIVDIWSTSCLNKF